jgi:hypothetical protein
MSGPSEVFERNYQDYRAQIANVDLRSIANNLGIVPDNDRMLISFFDDQYFLSNQGIADATGGRPDYVTFVILAKYILLCPGRSHHDPEWVSFKDFKRATHFTNVNYFASDVERAIEKHFSGKLPELEEASRKLGGTPAEMASFDLCMRFHALPRIDLLLLFNDKDEEFPARSTVLFQKHAEYYLDPESLAMTGACLAKKLKQALKA